MNFYKVEFPHDNDERTMSRTKAASLATLLEEEKKRYESDDRLSPCHGQKLKVSIDANMIVYEPGDGGSYTAAAYYGDRAAARAFIMSLR